MKILQIIPSLGRGGAERLVLNLSQKLKDMGHNVEIIYFDNQFKYPELKNSLVINSIPSSAYYSVFGKNEIRTEEFESFIKQFQPDIIHSHLVEAELVSRFHARANTAYITHWHGCPSLTNPIPFDQLFSKESIWKWNTKRILKEQYKKCNNHFLCISEFIQTYVQQNLSVEKKDTTIIHNSIDLNLFKPMGLPKKNGFRLISIGSLQKNKNHQFLFRVMKNLEKLGLKDIHLDIYGEGPEKDVLAKRIIEMNLNEQVVLHGIVHDIEKQINQSHLLVHCAWHEPFGLILIEAMACEIPVISFNTGGPSELVNNGVNGYLIEKDDIDAFSRRIIELYNDREKLTQMGKQGFEHSRNFGLEQYAQKIEALYEERLNQLSN